MVLEGDGLIRDFPGNYSQYREWVKLGKEDASFRPPGDGFNAPEEKQAENKTGPSATSSTTVLEKKKLSYKEKREFELLEKEIADLEKEKEIIAGKLGSSDTPFDELQRCALRSGEITRLLDEKELRWLELSEK
jgi:ABC transport system ATP-binding/permease protein